MPIKFSCHKCNSKLHVPEQHIGKQAKCPKCGEKCVVPATSEAAAPAGLPNVGAPQPPAAPKDDFAIPPLGGAAPAASSIAPPFPAPAGSPGFTPVGAPPAVAPVGGGSPFAAPPTPGAGVSRGGMLSSSVLQPLYEARGMMKLWGWITLILGIVYCLTIIGAIFGWVFIWMGILVKGAAQNLAAGVPTGNEQQLRMASKKLGTFFKILGVLAIIGLVIMCLYMVLIAVVIIGGAAGAANGGF